MIRINQINGIIACCILVLVFGCKTKNSANNERSEASINESIPTNATSRLENSLLVGYREFLSQLDSTDANSATIAAQKYTEVIGKQSASVCDSAFFEFSKFYTRLTNGLNEKHNNDTTNYDVFVFAKPETQLSKKLINYRKSLQKNGFDIDSEEGMTYIKQDRNFIAKHFYPYLSHTMKEYQTQLNTETAEGFISDASIIVPPQKLADRIAWYEKFTYENPNFIFIEDCRTTLKIYQTILFTGIDNTPIWSFDQPDSVSDYFETAYKYFLSKYPHSKTTALIKPFFSALSEKRTKDAEAIISKYRKDNVILNFNQ